MQKTQDACGWVEGPLSVRGRKRKYMPAALFVAVQVTSQKALQQIPTRLSTAFMYLSEPVDTFRITFLNFERGMETCMSEKLPEIILSLPPSSVLLPYSATEDHCYYEAVTQRTA